MLGCRRPAARQQVGVVDDARVDLLLLVVLLACCWWWATMLLLLLLLVLLLPAIAAAAACRPRGSSARKAAHVVVVHLKSLLILHRGDVRRLIGRPCQGERGRVVTRIIVPRSVSRCPLVVCVINATTRLFGACVINTTVRLDGMVLIDRGGLRLWGLR